LHSRSTATASTGDGNRHLATSVNTPKGGFSFDKGSKANDFGAFFLEGTMGVLRVKDGVKFEKIAPGGFEILRALTSAASASSYDIFITSGTDGEHSGPNDPHHRGEAYDVRTRGVPDKNILLAMIKSRLLFDQFYCFLEDPDTDNENIHCQVKKGTTYPPVQFANLTDDGD
jgi:hypothetical protein